MHSSNVQSKVAGYENISRVKVADCRIKSHLCEREGSCKCIVNSFIKREQGIVTSANPQARPSLSNPPPQTYLNECAQPLGFYQTIRAEQAFSSLCFVAFSLRPQCFCTIFSSLSSNQLRFAPSSPSDILSLSTLFCHLISSAILPFILNHNP